MGEKKETNRESYLPKKFNASNKRERISIKNLESDNIELYKRDPEIKQSKIKIDEMNAKHEIDINEMNAKHKIDLEKREYWWSKLLACFFLAFLFVSILKCWDIATDSKHSVETQKSAIAAGTTLITGTIAYFIGKHAAS